MNPAKSSNATAFDTFIAHKTHIDELLTRLHTLSDNHFNVHPDDIHWGHAGDLQRYASLLKEASDIAFNEGEYA